MDLTDYLPEWKGETGPKTWRKMQSSALLAMADRQCNGHCVTAVSAGGPWSLVGDLTWPGGRWSDSMKSEASMHVDKGVQGAVAPSQWDYITR